MRGSERVDRVDGKSPHVAFGLYCATVALKAKAGVLRTADKLGFAVCALEWVAEDGAARDAALRFLSECDRDDVAAGRALLDFLDLWAPVEDHRRVEAALESLPAEFHHEYDWQKRADLQ